MSASQLLFHWLRLFQHQRQGRGDQHQSGSEDQNKRKAAGFGKGAGIEQSQRAGGKEDSFAERPGQQEAIPGVVTGWIGGCC